MTPQPVNRLAIITLKRHYITDQWTETVEMKSECACGFIFITGPQVFANHLIEVLEKQN